MVSLGSAKADELLAMLLHVPTLCQGMLRMWLAPQAWKPSQKWDPLG